MLQKIYSGKLLVIEALKKSTVEKDLAKAKEVFENVKEVVEGAVEGIKNTFNK